MSELTAGLEAWRAAARELDATTPWTAAWLRARMVEEERRLAYQMLAAEREVEIDATTSTPDDVVAGPSGHGVTGATPAG
jgi:hypothetical protein